MKNKSCPFCQLDKQTEIFYYDKWKNIIISKDKNKLKFKYRLLGVRMGRENHKKIPMGEEREELLKPLIAVAEAHVKNGKAGGYDIDEVVGEEHYHYYCNFT